MFNVNEKLLYAPVKSLSRNPRHSHLWQIQNSLKINHWIHNDEQINSFDIKFLKRLGIKYKLTKSKVFFAFMMEVIFYVTMEEGKFNYT